MKTISNLVVIILAAATAGVVISGVGGGCSKDAPVTKPSPAASEMTIITYKTNNNKIWVVDFPDGTRCYISDRDNGNG